MSFRVVWRRRAKQQLANVWLNAADRAEVTAAAYRMENGLRRDPLGMSESRGGNFRMVFDGPLAILYEVDAPANRVRVISVGPAGPRP